MAIDCNADAPELVEAPATAGGEEQMGESPCGVVLEGGVTSAVLYASLLARLARRYTFRQLGGASSGAVAATAAAAAEYRRQQDAANTAAPQLVTMAASPAFDRLRDFPKELATVEAGRTLLLRLFKPSRRAHATFALVLACLDRTGRDTLGKRLRRGLLAIGFNFPVPAALALLTVGLMGVALAIFLAVPEPLPAALVWGVATVSTFVAAAGALAFRIVRVTVKALRDNHWGLCNGMGVDDQDLEALTPVLYGFFQELAGRSVTGLPLTFGDLWTADQLRTDANGGDTQSGTPGRCIDLQIVTTAVNEQRPVLLPGSTGTNPLRDHFYDPKEWAALFPVPVMMYLDKLARPVPLSTEDGRPLKALPDPCHWPVIVAARLSLSFPILLSAVPMYRALPRRERLRGEGDPKLPEFEARKVYFSDGGITSNCPIQLFDAPLPRFPTFGVNLYDVRRGRHARITRSDTRDPEFDVEAIPDATRWQSPIPFLGAILHTALDWRDGLQRQLPGYRERMVHVGLTADSGGLNLQMAPRTIRRLGRVGIVAAERLIRDFGTLRPGQNPNAWERHRWTRARSTLTALHSYVRALANCVDTGDPDYPRMVLTTQSQQYPWADPSARIQAADLLDGAQSLAQAVDAGRLRDAMDQNTPEPAPDLRMTPPW